MQGQTTGPGIELEFDKKTEKRIVYKGHIIMSRTEAAYLQQLIHCLALGQFERVLEVGFGLGISSRLIQDLLMPIEAHDIIEVEQQIYEDCQKFCLGYESTSAILGDFYSYSLRRHYDLVFCDPYDYELAKDQISLEECTDVDYRQTMAERAKELLLPGGILCYPFFGNAEMSQIDGFKLHYCCEYSGPPFLLWDGSDCAEAQCGYYELEE
jgi:hypothetical protein